MKHAKNIERISEIIAFILFLAGGQINSKAKLVKLVYLLDVIQARRGHPQFSGLQFKSYYAGPYSSEIEVGISVLLQRGHLTITARDYLDGNYYYHFQLNQLPPFGQLTTAEQEEIQDSLKSFIPLGVKELLTIACATKEFQNVSLGEMIAL